MDTLSNSQPNIIPWEYNAEDGHYHPHNVTHHRLHCLSYGLNESDNSTEEGDSEHTAPYSILFLFGVFAIGAIVRFLLKHLRLPYTVVLFVLGVLFGLAANHYEPLQRYTELANMSPHLILYIFLPILIFESAFAMDTHTFFRCSVQCLILAVPGLLISTALTAVLSVNLFLAYDWGWPTALLFGSILSATDPVAVVALLREIGTSKTLSTLVEGESLLNDGSAIVAYSVLIELVVPGTDIDARSILVKFCQISLGGPALGFMMGKISVFCLSRVFNDAMIEITITLSAAYITYYLAEAVLKVSGVLALVALGVVISGEKDSISPEVEVFVHKFWENLSYLANTVIFIVVGIVVADAGADFIEKQDWFLICATYVGSTVFRFMMIGILSPALSRLGYGLRWQDAVVMTWGGLRGAVGLALALLVSEQEGIDKEKVGHKILIHVSGIVLLTLLVNATTIKPLLTVLGMSDISNWKRRNMAVAVRHLHDIQGRSIHVQKNNQFLADADWKHIEMITTINNPFSVRKQTKEETEDEENDCDSDSASYAILRYSSCPDCELHHVISPNQKELEDMFNEARLRMISAQKVSYWRQFENGLLAQENVRVLLSAADVAADKDKSFVTVEDLRTHWKIPFVYDWLERQLREQVPRKMSQESSEASDLNSMTTTCPHNIRQFIRHPFFDYTVYIIISLSVIFLGLEAAFRIHKSIRKDHPIICDTLQIINYVFFVLYLVEITLKMVRFTCKRYWRIKWNQFDVVMLLFYVADLVLHFIADYGLPNNSREQDILILVYCGVRLVRVLRILRLLKLVRHRLLAILDTVINSYLNAGYDIGCGFLVGEEEVMKMIEDIVDYQPIVKELQSICEQNRNQIIRELAQLQEKHSSVAVAVKTRHAARSILNNSRDELNELKEKGLLDDGVYEQLMDAIEKQMKRLVNSPTSMLPAPPIELLRNVEWIADCDDIFNFIKNRATVVKFPKGKLLYSCGDQPSGIYIITVGIIKIEGHIVDMDGELPNTDSFHWFSSQDYFEDCLTAANVLGELGALSKKPMNTNAICETEVQAFHIAQEAMERAFTTFKEHPSIEYNMWRTCALRIAKTVLKNNPQYVDWSTGRIMMHLQRALLPDLRGLTSFTLESEMQDVILIQGRAKDPNTGEVYRGVAYIPRTVYTLNFENYDDVRPILLIVGSLDITSGSAGQHNQMEWADRRQRWSICPPAPSRCLLHQVRRRSAIPAGSRRSSRARASTSRGSRGSWVEGLPDYFHPRTYSQPIDLQDEKPKSRTSLKPDVTVTVVDPIPGEISISVPAGVVARRRSTLDLPFNETSEM